MAKNTKKKSGTKKTVVVDNFLDLRNLSDPRKSQFKLPRAYIVSIGVIFVIVISVAIFFVLRGSNNPGKQKLDRVLPLVSKHIILPKDEEPTMATVTDHDSLQEDSFLYKKSINGDVVLIYAKAGRAIIYRPSVDRIIDIGPVFVDSGQHESKNAKIVIRDSTNRSEVVKHIADQVKKAYPSAVVSQGDPTTRANYPNSIVIDNTGNKDSLVSGLMSVAGLQRGVRPLAELKFPEDVTVIVGTDAQ